MNGFILLVDGDAQHAMSVEASFSSNGLATVVHVVGDGYEALDFLFSSRALEIRGGSQPALILLDLSVPVMHGLHVLQTVKADPRTAEIPVIMLTSPASELDIHAAIKNGADSIVEKPLTFHKLLLAAKRLGIRLDRSGHGLVAGDRLSST